MNALGMLPRSLAALLLILVSASAVLGEAFVPKQELELGPIPVGHNIYKRQLTTTTPRPKKKRPSNIFSLVSVLISETRDDTSRAFNEIGTIFNSQFSNTSANTATTARPSTTSSTPASDNEEDNEITTTTEPYRITRNEFLGILRSNVQGLVRLFGKEFRIALRDSNRNVKEFGKEFREALRPYVT